MGNHGGKRPGAGAKKGNINALKHGRYSKTVDRLLDETGGGFYILDKKHGLRFVYRQEK